MANLRWLGFGCIAFISPASECVRMAELRLAQLEPSVYFYRRVAKCAQIKLDITFGFG